MRGSLRGSFAELPGAFLGQQFANVQRNIGNWQHLEHKKKYVIMFIYIYVCVVRCKCRDMICV